MAINRWPKSSLSRLQVIKVPLVMLHLQHRVCVHQAAAELAKARAAAAAAAEAAGPQVCDSWEWMVEGVLREVLSSLDFPALKRFRLTCARWRAVADRNLQARRAEIQVSCCAVKGSAAWTAPRSRAFA